MILRDYLVFNDHGHCFYGTGFKPMGFPKDLEKNRQRPHSFGRSTRSLGMSPAGRKSLPNRPPSCGRCRALSGYFWFAKSQAGVPNTPWKNTGFHRFSLPKKIVVLGGQRPRVLGVKSLLELLRPAKISPCFSGFLSDVPYNKDLKTRPFGG